MKSCPKCGRQEFELDDIKKMLDEHIADEDLHYINNASIYTMLFLSGFVSVIISLILCYGVK